MAHFFLGVFAETEISAPPLPHRNGGGVIVASH
jgi:hypothetical protein